MILVDFVCGCCKFSSYESFSKSAVAQTCYEKIEKKMILNNQNYEERLIPLLRSNKLTTSSSDSWFEPGERFKSKLFRTFIVD